jgi:hypothetical protein
MIRSQFRLAAAAAGALVALAAATPAHAQSGAGVAGAMVLQLPAGSRAASFSGAYTGMTGDADVLFYNPAGLASFNAGAGAAFEPLVEGISFGSAAGSFHVGRLALGAGIAYLNGGSVEEFTPDPLFGGQRGTATGQSVSATESAARFGASYPLAQGRVRIGASAGFVSTSIAGASSGAPMFDLGAQVGLLPSLTVGASLRNFGGSLSGDSTAAPLPAEARVGLSYARSTPSGLGMAVSADFVAGLKEHTSGLVAGAEAGLIPAANRRLGAVARVGFSGAQGSGGLAPLQVGGGLSLGAIALDYTFQNLNYFGAVHRIGIRWLSPLR